LEGGLNPYGYAYQNPLIYRDPDGELPWVAVPLLVALLWPHYANAPAPDAMTYNGTDAVVAAIIAASEVPASPLGVVKRGIKSCVAAKGETVESFLRGLGRRVEKNPLEGVLGAGRQGDFFVDGKLTELKTLDPGATSNTI
jgi:hypothetical protein